MAGLGLLCCCALLAALVTAAGPAWAGIDVEALWDFGRPELSEQRFRSALADATDLRAPAADALHMMALVENGLEAQLAATRRVVDYARASSQPAARRWDGPALNNMGAALNAAGQPERALPLF